ncbi:hypothetical protein M885DRAFT_402844, partial [Pelagophyceae sp. CCMP2097]
PPATRKPCCVCAAPDGKHCIKCKSRHYCSKACQVVDWKRGHNKACKQLAAEFQDHLLDTLMPEKLKIKEEPPIVEDVAPAAVGSRTQRFYECCGKKICAGCSSKCSEYDERCTLCRTPPPTSEAVWLRRVHKHVDKGHAEAQYLVLGQAFTHGDMGLKQSHKQAVQLYQLAAAQGNALAQTALGSCYESGEGVKIDFKAAALWYRRAAEQAYPLAQANLG